ncbi:MAG: hypothetical protein ACM3N5_05970 [Candidatus Eiseniibacteriota bacterium]
MAPPPRPKIDSPVRQPAAGAHPPTASQLAWLKRGLDQPGGKLPLFDADGKQVDARTIKRCVEAGWAEPWFANPIKPDWLVCKLTPAGRALATRAPRARSAKPKQPAAERPGATPLPLR